MKIYIYKLSEYLQKIYNREAKKFFDIDQNKHKLIFSGGGQVFGSNNRVVPFQDAMPIGSNEGQDLTIAEDIYPITFEIEEEPQHAIINDNLPDDNLLPHSNEIRDVENSITFVDANPSNSYTVIKHIKNKIKKIDKQIRNYQFELDRLRELQNLRRRHGRRTFESSREFRTQTDNIEREIRHLLRERREWQQQLPIEIS
jgi:hypothetical protein